MMCVMGHHNRTMTHTTYPSSCAAGVAKAQCGIMRVHPATVIDEQKIVWGGCSHECGNSGSYLTHTRIEHTRAAEANTL